MNVYEAAFWAAIAEGDELARLALSDWLEEPDVPHHLISKDHPLELRGVLNPRDLPMSRILDPQTVCFQGPVEVVYEPRVVVVTLLERLYFDLHTDLLGETMRQVSANPEVRLIAVDLTPVTGIGNAVLGHFIRCIRELRRRGGHMALCNLFQPIREVVHLTRLDRVFHIADTLEQGIAWLVAAPLAAPQLAYPVG